MNFPEFVCYTSSLELLAHSSMRRPPKGKRGVENSRPFDIPVAAESARFIVAIAYDHHLPLKSSLASTFGPYFVLLPGGPCSPIPLGSEERREDGELEKCNLCFVDYHTRWHFNEAFLVRVLILVTCLADSASWNVDHSESL